MTMAGEYPDCAICDYVTDLEEARKEIAALQSKVDSASTNNASPKLLNELYERFIFDDGVDEVTASGAQEFRDFVIQQLSGE